MTDEEYFCDSIRRLQHYVFSRARRRLRKFQLLLDIELGLVDIGGEG